MVNKKVFTNLNLLSFFLIFILAILSIHVMLSDSFVTGQQRDSLLSYLPENFRVLFINNQSSMLSNADLSNADISNEASIVLAQSKIAAESSAVNVLEDLPRGSTRIEDIDSQSKDDILINSTQLKEIERIIELKEIERIIENKISGIDQI
jgi:hypothetical protein